jgi:hypothetical protein
MKSIGPSGATLSTLLVISGLLFLPGQVTAHCDSMDGPVVHAAQKALETNTVEIALAWVTPAGEKEIRDAFDRTMRVRAAGGEAQELADRWFFETLVRVHRLGEGEAYTGLKPAGSEIAPGILAADHALEEGDAHQLVAHLSEELTRALSESFDRVVALSEHDPQDVSAGRRYVRAYTEYMHFVEGLYGLLTGGVGSHWAAHDAHAAPPPP